MTKNLAFIFPGQGSQSVGMLAEFAAEPIVINTFQEASDVLGYDVWHLAQQGPEEKLNQTEFTQPALLAADIALWRCWQARQGIIPAVVAGHSLGEYAALVCAESLAFTDAIQLVANRGRYMQEAVAAGEGAMAAIVGMEDEQVAQLCKQAAQGDVLSPANFNSIGQVVIAGTTAAVQRALALAPTLGAKLAKQIPVSVPSHCALMQSAAEKLAKDLAGIHFATPKIKVIHNADVAMHTDAEAIRRILAAQLTQSVRWVETIVCMQKMGVDMMVECGPGKVLAGLGKRIDKSINLLSIQTPELLLEEIQHAIK